MIRHGQLVSERHFHGYHRNQLHLICSDTKSAASALAGTALDHGEIGGLQESVLPFFLEYAPMANLYPWK